MEKQSSKLLILTGHSGAGKDAVSAGLRKATSLATVIPHTTRAKRIGERDGDPYYFITEREFFDMVGNEEFVEYKSYITQFNGVKANAYYGTALACIPTTPSIITIGVEAGINLKKQLGNAATIVYLHVSDAVREERAKARGSFDKIEWDNRLAQDHIRFGGEIPKGMDVIIDNMQPLTTTIQDILNIKG